MDKFSTNGSVCHMMDKIITNTNDATWWTNIQLIQVAPTGGRIFKANDATWWPNNSSCATWWTNFQQM